MGKKSKIELEAWIERDLSAACQAGELPPAFEVDELLRQVEETLLAGNNRSPVLVGPRGVGKSAVYHALIDRLHRGEGPEALRGARVVQFSFKAIAGRFPPNTGKATDFAQKLFDYLLSLKEPVLPLIRDVHAAYALDWEAMLHRFLGRARLPILAEALPSAFDEMVEYWSDLTEYLVPIVVKEPPVPTVKRIVERWDAHGAAHGRRAFQPEAQGVAIELTARYMGDRSFPRKVLDLLEQTRVLADKTGDVLGLDAVVARFSQLTRVPGSLVDPRERLDLDDVHAFLAGRLLGQHEAVDVIVRMIALIKAGLTDLRRPFGVLLFVGPTGVGKTHAAQLLAEYLFGDRQRLIRVNMADYGNEGDVATLFGSPYGNNLAQKRGVLASRLMGHPFGVLLLDEFEKAHPRVHDAFLQLIDEGRFINGMGETVSAASMIIIATSNAGVEVYRETGLGFTPQRDLKALDRELDRRLLKTFRFEFLNRFDHVVHFHPLSRAHIRDIARRELADLVKRDGIHRRDLALEFSMELLDWVVAHGYHPHFGARFLRREIERSVTAALADFLVRREPPKGARLELGVVRDRPVVREVVEPLVVLPAAEDESDLALTASELRAEAERLVAAWAALEAQHAERAAEASALIEQSQAPTFWDDPAQAQRTLKRYTTLDARL
ncbi:MAG: ATP-dependent Clp protease ATP-binding subunit, partial [Myxococcales bacterium]|nr:ATP-dependent Clp protease ATP-binding subunit [Myxococcales bacterium]